MICLRASMRVGYVIDLISSLISPDRNILGDILIRGIRHKKRAATTEEHYTSGIHTYLRHAMRFAGEIVHSSRPCTYLFGIAVILPQYINSLPFLFSYLLQKEIQHAASSQSMRFPLTDGMRSATHSGQALRYP